MIAQDRNEATFLGHGQQCVDHSLAVRPTIDVIAQHDQRIVGRRIDRFEKRLERGRAAMNVADCNGSGHGWLQALGVRLQVGGMRILSQA